MCVCGIVGKINDSVTLYVSLFSLECDDTCTRILGASRGGRVVGEAVHISSHSRLNGSTYNVCTPIRLGGLCSLYNLDIPVRGCGKR